MLSFIMLTIAPF